MASATQKAVLSACREFMKPLVRLLLKNGIGYREFSDICKSSFVAVASDEFGIRRRKTNMSRVAVMTGLSRKEVKKVRNSTEIEMLASMSRTRRPELVLSAWHSDPEYCDKANMPRPIYFDGPGPSFKNLIDRVGGDIPPRAMLNELIRAGSVVEDGDRLFAVSRSYIPEPNDPEAILVAGGAIRDLMSTIDHNLSCIDHEMRFFERRVYSKKLPSVQRERFRKLAADRGEELLRDLNAWLSERESPKDEKVPVESQGDQGPRLGVGVFFFDDSNRTQ